MNKKIKYGCIVIIGLLFIGLAIALLTFPVLMQQAFGPTKETIEINQEVGGTLICESEYNADLASWFYDVEYKYRTDSGEIIPIGRGEYYGQDWNKNEQILTWKNWHLLKTGGGFYSEKLLIGSLDKSNWNEFIFSPENIEKDSIWKSKRIASKMGWLPQRAKLRNWGNGIIQVDYLFRTGEEIEQQENRLITYELDSLSGIPEMIKIETAVWKCEHCGFIHSKETDLPFDNWEEEYNSADSTTALRFWEGFFRIATEHPESYWKQCNVCTRILPFNAFSKHSGWGPLEKQMECRSCKGAINAVLNPKRTKEQLHESAVRRRIADLFIEEENESIDFQDLFKRFESRCFKTKEPLDINQRDTWSIDHILPSKYLYPLKKENAALLSKNANENKRDKWPSKFYTNNELIDLARITGANIDLISNKLPIMNHNIDVNKGVERYLQVREKSDLPKRIKEIKKILLVYELVDNLSLENKKLLGFE